MKLRGTLPLLFIVSLSACGSARDPSSSGSNPIGGDDTGTKPNPGDDTGAPGVDSGTPVVDTGSGTDTDPGTDGLVVQEWGTYTSVQSSDGHAIGGLHHEDERLPSFVLRRNWTDRSNYYFENLPEEPLQQLETPVLYFWSKKAQQVSVKIDFPQGVVGQWYPDAKAFSPALGACTSMGPGSMTWDVTVDPSIDAKTFPSVDPTEIWAPSRNVKSTPVRYANDGTGVSESEQFIFYRGLGKFEPSVRVTETADGVMHVTNGSPDDVRAAFVLRVTSSGGTITGLGALGAGKTIDTAVPTTVSPIDAYLTDARRSVKTALMGSGLADDVAQAMVDTWTRSWFKNVGLRVLYVAPRKWTDGWLPTTITPTPKSLVRTLVGRIESLTPSEENDLLAQIHANAPSGAPIDLSTLGRFAEPRLRRALEQLTDAKEKSYTQSLIDSAHALP